LCLELDAYYPRRLRYLRWGPKQQSIDDAEHHRVGADAQRQREHGHDGETRGRTQLSDSVAEVLSQCGQHGWRDFWGMGDARFVTSLETSVALLPVAATAVGISSECPLDARFEITQGPDGQRDGDGIAR
jgi:hypothetical protein